MNALVPIRPAVLDGEILGPEQSVEVIVALNIFSDRKERIRVPVGSTLAEIVAIAETGYIGPRPPSLAAIIGDQYIAPQFWHRIRPKPGVFVAVRATPGAKDNSFLRTILLLAVSAVALLVPVLGPGLSATAAGLIGAGITIGGTLLINALFPIRPPALEDANKKQTYSIAGGSNAADPHGPVPFHLGTNRYFPHRAAADVVNLVGDDQYFTTLLVWGYARVTLADIKIGETPLEDFDDFEIEHDQFFEADSETLKLYPNQVLQEDLAIKLDEAAGYQTRTTPTEIETISVTVTAPNGIFRFVKATGERLTYPVKVRAHYRRVGTEAWQLLLLKDLKSRSDETIRFGARKRVTKGQYEVRVGKVSGDFDGPDTVEVQETLFWSRMETTRNGPPITFDSPLTVTAIRIKATDQLNGTVDTINAVCTARGWTYSGTSWAANGSDSNPASLVRQVLQGPFNKRPVATAKIDLTTLEAFWHYCDDNGFTFNMVRDFRASVWDTISDICATARARPCFKDGKWSVIWEEIDAPIAGHFSPRNSRGFTEQRNYAVKPHAFMVEFINAEKGYKRDERIVYDDGYDASNATLFERIEFPGISNPELIWRLARYHIAQARLRPSSYSLIVAREQIKNTIADRVRVQHDLPLIGLTSGRVKSVVGQAITIDEPVTMVAGTSYGVRFQTDAGTSLLRNVATNDGVNSVITLSGSGAVPAAGNLFLFGERDAESASFRVSKIKHNDEAEAVLTLVDDAPEIMEADQGDIPPFDSHITIPPDAATLAPVDLRIVEQVTAQAGKVSIAALFSWDTVAGNAAVAFDVGYRDDDGDQIWRNAGRVPAERKYNIITRLSRGPWSFRVRAIFAAGVNPSKWAALAGRTITGEGRVPADVDNFRIRVRDQFATLSWDRVTTAGLSHYVIRFSPLLSGATWASAALLQDNVTTTNILVPTRAGSYLIRAMTLAGIASLNPTIISSNVAGLIDLNVDETYTAEPSWTGTKTNVEVNTGDLRLIAFGTIEDWPEIDTLPALVWVTQFPYAFGSFVPTSPDYIDLGEVMTSRVTSKVDAVGENINNFIGTWGLLGELGLIGGDNAERWAVIAYESHTEDDPAGSPTWTDYAEITAADLTFRAIRVKLELYSLNAYVRPLVSSWIVNVDMPDRVEAGEDLLVSAGAALVVTFPNGAFRVLRGISIADQDMATGDYHLITAKSETGFSIRYFNAAGAGISRTFDYLAKGYGKIL